jgi:hypothetical protein
MVFGLPAAGSALAALQPVEVHEASELVCPAAQLTSPEAPPQPIGDAPSADLPADNASSIIPKAKMVFLLAVMFVSCLGLPAR